MIKIKELKKCYDKNTALDIESLELPDQGLVFIIGKSGSGKTTFLSLLVGLSKCTTGSIIVDDIDITKLSEAELDHYRRYNTALIMQDPIFLENFDCLENMLISANLLGKNDTSINKKDCLEVLEKFKLDPELYNRKVNELSGGERQRFYLALTTLRNPKILLADEPTGNLDSVNSEIIFDTLKSLSVDRLIIVVTHDLSAAAAYGDRIIRLESSRIIDDYKNMSGKIIHIEQVEKNGNKLSEIVMPYYRLPSFDFITNNLYSIRKEDQEFESYEPSTLAVTDKVQFKTFAKLISHNFHRKYLSTISLVLLMSIFFVVMAASIYCISFNLVGFLSNAIMTDDRNEFQIYQTVRINEENYEILRGPELYKKTLDAAENSLQKNIIKTKEYNFGGQTLKAYFYSSEDDEVLVYEGSSLDSVDLYGRNFQTKICDKLPSGTIGISTKVLASLGNDAEYLSMDIENFSFYHADPGTIGLIDTYAYSQDSLAEDRLLVGRKPKKVLR